MSKKKNLTPAVDMAVVPDDFKVFNCGKCGLLSLGERHTDFYDKLPPDEQKRWPAPFGAKVGLKLHCRPCVDGEKRLEKKLRAVLNGDGER